ncbi:MAG TPA: lipoprotein [Steroidobacteraceae bacterium]|nr:lipoprotein [Steroidobacteraceae bacterium]
MTGRRARGWIAAVGALLVCAGCGFKGPLYLPGRNAAVITRPPPAGSAGQTQTPPARKKQKTSPDSQPPATSAAPWQ